MILPRSITRCTASRIDIHRVWSPFATDLHGSDDVAAVVQDITSASSVVGETQVAGVLARDVPTARRSALAILIACAGSVRPDLACCTPAPRLAVSVTAIAIKVCDTTSDTECSQKKSMLFAA